MTEKRSGLTRRTALKGLGGAAATVGVGGAALLATAGPAAAATQDYGDVTITSDDGTVQHVSIYGESTIEWTGFENPVESVDVLIEAKLDDGSYVELYQTSADLTQDSWGGTNDDHTGVGTSGTLESAIGLDGDGNYDESTSWAIVQSSSYDDGYPIPTNHIPASELEVGTDGESSGYTITVRSTYAWNDGDGNEEFSKQFTADVNVTVNDKPRSVSGSGSSGATGA